MQETPASATPFELIGGQPTVDRIVDTFYDRMSELPEVNASGSSMSEASLVE